MHLMLIDDIMLQNISQISKEEVYIRKYWRKAVSISNFQKMLYLIKKSERKEEFEELHKEMLNSSLEFNNEINYILLVINNCIKNFYTLNKSGHAIYLIKIKVTIKKLSKEQTCKNEAINKAFEKKSWRV